MAPAVHLALALLLFPAFILSEPLHVPLARRQTRLINWTDEANKLRIRYGYPMAPSPLSHRSNRRAVAGVPVLDQVGIVIVFVLYQLITRIGCGFQLYC